MKGQRVCSRHGGRSPQALAAAARALELAAAQASIQKLIPDNPEPVKDPIGVLARLAGEADSVRAVVVTRINELAGTHKGDVDVLMKLDAHLAIYDRYFDRTAKTCEALVRSNYLERHAAIEEAQVAAFLAVVHRAMDLIPDVGLRRIVTAQIGTGLKALPVAS